MWQGFLRNVLPDGSLRRLPQRRAAHVRRQDDAGRCLCRRPAQRARRIDAGVTLRARLVAHPQLAGAHRRLHQGIAGIPACGRCSPMAPARTRPAGSWRSRPPNIPATSRGCASSISPATISSSTLYLAALGGAPEATSSQFKAARDVGARITIHVGVGEFGRNALLEKLNAIERAQGRHHLHPLLHAERHRVEADQGHRRHDLDRRLRRDADGPRQSADPEGDRPRHPAVAQRRRRDLGAERLLHPDAHRVLAAEERGLGEAARRRQEPAGSSSRCARCWSSPPSKARAPTASTKKVGTLTPGKEADIIMLRTDLLNVMPINNAVGAVVTSMTAQNVDTVLIAGKVMKRNGKLVGVDMNRDRQARAGRRRRAPTRPPACLTSASEVIALNRSWPGGGCPAMRFMGLKRHDRSFRHRRGRRRPQQPGRGGLSREGRLSLPGAGGALGARRQCRHRGVDAARLSPRFLRHRACHPARQPDDAERRAWARRLRARIHPSRDRLPRAVSRRQLAHAVPRHRTDRRAVRQVLQEGRRRLPAHDRRVRRDQAAVRCGVLYADRLRQADQRPAQRASRRHANGCAARRSRPGRSSATISRTITAAASCCGWRSRP